MTHPIPPPATPLSELSATDHIRILTDDKDILEWCVEIDETLEQRDDTIAHLRETIAHLRQPVADLEIEYIAARHQIDEDSITARRRRERFSGGRYAIAHNDRAILLQALQSRQPVADEVIAGIQARHDADENARERTRAEYFDAAIACFDDRATLLQHGASLVVKYIAAKAEAAVLLDGLREYLFCLDRDDVRHGELWEHINSLAQDPRPIAETFLTEHKALQSRPAPGVTDGIGPNDSGTVFFYERDYYPLSNFSAFRVYRNSRDFDTSEAAYHFDKFHYTGATAGQRDIADKIRASMSAHAAFKLAEQHKALRRPDWDDVKINIMRDILRAKAAQHEYVRRKLLATGDRELVENSWRDDYWGWGPNRTGKNMLGKLWMEVRAELALLNRSAEV